MTSRFQVVPAAYVICCREGAAGTEILLQLRRNTGYMDGHWACAAAGHVEAGESVLEAAVREAQEEIGITISPTDLTALTAMHRTHRNGRPVDERIDLFFTCRTWQGEARTMEPEKSEGLDWYSLTALPEPVVPHELVVLEALRTGTVPPILTHGFSRSEIPGR
ncbi:MAG TPA: NUDIX domain-containing protein [Candidatus Ruania gallistercoris]|uniref:NUDIX domain-containing protein n=1 Tax=Candidatus Ruania gallistercoris TaxID=2838746 RepID=A0A9D2ED86_9MICO|nr:NUDIX domain-containing protein [Candidatus Ruania gallistercoris]